MTISFETLTRARHALVSRLEVLVKDLDTEHTCIRVVGDAPWTDSSEAAVEAHGLRADQLADEIRETSRAIVELREGLRQSSM